VAEADKIGAGIDRAYFIALNYKESIKFILELYVFEPDNYLGLVVIPIKALEN